MKHLAFPGIMLACVLASHVAHSQNIDLEHAGAGFQKGNLLKLGGYVSANALYSASNNPENERLPFTYFLNGGVNARLFQLIDVPVQFTITNVGGQFNYPTLPTRLSIHPTYKWATAHIGNTAMALSPYTVNGHLFDGAALELQPGKFRLTALYGRFQRAENYDSSNLASPAAYHRIGWGVKAGYVTDRVRVAYTVFRAKDDPNSISILPPDSLGITPQENLVMSIEGGVQIMKGLDLTAEHATSGLTTNTNAEALTETSKDGGFQPLDPFLKRRVSSEYHNAWRGNLNYRLRKAIIGLGYERVDPGYKTLGAYFFNNDLESFTLNVTQQALKDRLTIAVAGGYQHDNLDDLKGSINHRGVVSANLSFFQNERFNLIASYSNFLTYINVQSQFQHINQANPYQYIDTLNFSQISQNAMVSINQVLSKSDLRVHAINVMVNFLKANDKKGDEVDANAASSFYNGAVSWSTQYVPKRINTTLGINASLNHIGANNFLTIGPTASAAWYIIKEKLFAGLALSYNQTSGSNVSASHVFNSRLNANYVIRKDQSVTLGLMGQQRSAEGKNPSDMILTLGYDLRF